MFALQVSSGQCAEASEGGAYPICALPSQVLWSARLTYNAIRRGMFKK